MFTVPDGRATLTVTTTWGDAVRDGLEGTLRRLAATVEDDASHLSDPLVVACEAAHLVVVTTDARDPRAVVEALARALPQSTTVMERSVALGMVLALRASSP